RLNFWLPARAADRELTAAEMERVTRCIQIASKFVPKATCLTQALSTQALLGRAGCQTHLRFGVQRSEGSGEFQAHAWVEHAGRVVIGDNGLLAKFTVLPSID